MKLFKKLLFVKTIDGVIATLQFDNGYKAHVWYIIDERYEIDLSNMNDVVFDQRGADSDIELNEILEECSAYDPTDDSLDI
jgi:hypothetical protein